MTYVCPNAVVSILLMVAGFSAMACFSMHFLAVALLFVLPATFWAMEVCSFTTLGSVRFD